MNLQFQHDGRATSHECHTEKMLGYRFFPATDQIALERPDSTLFNSGITKRSILSYTAKLFDPLGLTLPVFVKAKILMRDLWKAKVDWDEQNVVDSVKWSKIRNDLDKLADIHFQRKTYSTDDEVALKVFCDSSKELYGFCCYAENLSVANDRHLIFAKAKTAPLKPRSLPTLELMAVYLALKCLPSLLKSVGKVTDVTVYCDAKVVLSWVQTSKVKSKNIFAANRVKDVSFMRKEIKSNFEIDCKFEYIPTGNNPADLITRGLSYDSFKDSLDFWLNGPNLQVPESPVISENNTVSLSACTDKTEPILPVNRFSNITKLLNVTSLVFYFIAKLRRKCKSKLECLNDAKVYWLRNEQRQHFPTELDFLHKPTHATPTLVKNLNLFLDDNDLIRCKGRLGNCDYLNNDVRNPILIPKQSFLTELFVARAHLDCKHLGMATTLATIRKMGLWVPQGRTVVKSFLSKCITCRKLNTFAYKYPKVNDYVSDKVTYCRPFQNTGIDFTGSVSIKLGTEIVKMYILVYTCMNIRAIHLDLLPSMSCHDFLLSFIRFCNAHSIPNCIFSDNASTFIQAMGIVSNSFSDNEFDSFLLRNNVKHVKIPLYAAWVGASWERMIRTIKTSIRKIIGRKIMPYIEFVTLLSDVQNSVNSRPLTYLDENFNAITPNSFLKQETGRALLLDGIAGTELLVPNRQQLTAQLEKRDETLAHFKQLWVDEYLLSLRETARDVYQTEWHNRLKPGDIVLISSPNKPRHVWQMGRVLQLLPGKDGVVRTVKLLRPDRSEGIYTINLLYPLELSIVPDAKDEFVDEPAQEIPGTSKERPPKRAAAIRCMKALKGSN